ncbi:hypothetical protein K1W54_13340 [Micromonospora sp. CPCC 205371]|nr:hypothetical protein [Micromonospora sp. CPCC 205371]
MPEITHERLAAIRARLAAATPGPWKHDPGLAWNSPDAPGGAAQGHEFVYAPGSLDTGYGVIALTGVYGKHPQSEPDAALIAHARTDLEDLLEAAAVLCHARAIAERQRYLLKPDESTRWCRDGCPVCADRKWHVQSSGGVLRELCELLLSGPSTRYSDSTPEPGRD